MATIKTIETDLIKESSATLKKVVHLALGYGLKDGQTVLIKKWSPKRKYYWEKWQFNYYHKIYGLEPNCSKIQGDLEEINVLRHTNVTIKKTAKSDEIKF